MTTEKLQHTVRSHPNMRGESPHRRVVSNYERELANHRYIEARLREALAADDALLSQKDELIRQQQLLSGEFDHRLMNSLQMVVSLLSLQSRASANAETASQLTAAANRVSTIGRVHRRLHSLDGTKTVAFKQYVEDLCRDFSAMLSSEGGKARVIVVEGIEVELPSVIAVPLGFIVNELVTNAAKNGQGRITIRLEPNHAKGYALSVCNDGPTLPHGFDPSICKGLGLKIVRSFVEKIGGELRFGQADNKQGARFTVLFSRELKGRKDYGDCEDSHGADGRAHRGVVRSGRKLRQ